MSVQILQGDCRVLLPTLEGGSVQCCVTSPPYFGLRDYNVAGQIGLEPTVGEFVSEMVGVFREVRRVLADDGTLWLNLGDSYAAPSPGGPTGATGQRQGRTFTMQKMANRAREIPAKNLIGIPWRVALALQDDGWYLRQDIIWHKPNPMPESVQDRCTKAHEYLFLLTKSPRYYFDAAAIAEPVTDSTKARLSQSRIGEQEGSNRVPGKSNGNMKAVGSMSVRNKRSVWTIPTKGFKDAHFAVFPEALVEPCVRAGSREGDTVLDPFGGSGTTAGVANRLGRHSVVIELNSEYIPMIERRTAQRVLEIAS